MTGINIKQGKVRKKLLHEAGLWRSDKEAVISTSLQRSL